MDLAEIQHAIDELIEELPVDQQVVLAARLIEELPVDQQVVLAARIAGKLPKDLQEQLADEIQLAIEVRDQVRDQKEWDAEMERDFSPGGDGMALVEEWEQDIRAGKYRPFEEGLRKR